MVVAITKLVAQLGAMPAQVAEVCGKYKQSSQVLLSKYCSELEGQ